MISKRKGKTKFHHTRNTVNFLEMKKKMSPNNLMPDKIEVIRHILFLFFMVFMFLLIVFMAYIIILISICYLRLLSVLCDFNL